MSVPYLHKCNQMQKNVLLCVHVTLAGAWIQMAGLNRMWSHSCLRSKMPFCKLLRYLEKANTMSRTGRVTCTLEDWSTDSATTGGEEKEEDDMSAKGVKDVESKKGRERAHAEKDEEELLFCLTSTQASRDLQNTAEGKTKSVPYQVLVCVCGVKGIRMSLITALGSLHAATGMVQGLSCFSLPAEPIFVCLTFSKV